MKNMSFLVVQTTLFFSISTVALAASFVHDVKNIEGRRIFLDRDNCMNKPIRPSWSIHNTAIFALAEVDEQTTTTTKMDVVSPLIVKEMPQRLPETLKNKYYGLRHGQSTANVAGVISSARSLAYSDKHGVTAVGYEQGKESSKQLIDFLEEESSPGEKVIFVSSPFARARQTAQACLDGLEEMMVNDDDDDSTNLAKRLKKLELDISNDIILDERLMERFFGRLDDEAIYAYAYVWPLDGFDVTHTAFDVESVAAVCTRINDLVQDYESKYENYHIIWVSHADVLQIAQLYAANVDNVGKFSSYRFKNGEIRAMKSTPDTLPDPDPLQAPKRGTQM